MTPVMQTNSCGNVLLFFVSCVLSHNLPPCSPPQSINMCCIPSSLLIWIL